MQILIINEAERKSIGLYNRLKRSAPNIPVYQDKVEKPRNKTIWSLLGGGKDDFFIYDRCGRLAYYVPYPISFLYRPYAQAAILSTYFGEPCGPCPSKPSPPPSIVNSNCNYTESNCTDDDFNCAIKDSNCTISNFNDSISTDNGLNVTLTSIANQTISVTVTPVSITNTSRVTPNVPKEKFNRVIEELKNKFGHTSTESPKHRNSLSNGHDYSHHRKSGFRFSRKHSQITTTTITTTAPPITTTHRIRHHHHQRHHRGKQEPTTTQSPTTISPPLTDHDHGHANHRGHKGHHSNSTHKNSTFYTERNNSSINSVHYVLKGSEILTSDKFYAKFYPDYEMILNLALIDWLNKSIPNRSNVTKSIPPTKTTTTTTPVSVTTSSSNLSKQSHLSSLLENLKRIKQRQRSELVH